MNIFVGNLSFGTKEDDIRAAFEAHGQVSTARVVMDRETGRSRGFGFVEMSNDAEATTAMEKLNGSDFGGRKLTINEARPMEARSSGGGDRGGRGGDRGGRGGGYGGGNKW